MDMVDIGDGKVIGQNIYLTSHQRSCKTADLRSPQAGSNIIS